jgi:hypothetical protein
VKIRIATSIDLGGWIRFTAGMKTSTKDLYMELKGTTETFVQEIWTVALSAIGVIGGIPK